MAQTIKREIAVIGVGRLGGALTLALAEKGYLIRELVIKDALAAGLIAGMLQPNPQILTSVNLERITADVIVIATQDSEIQQVADDLAVAVRHKPIVFHTSGSLSSRVLHGLTKIGCSTGSIHPLVSISDAVSGAESFADIYFCIEGEHEAVGVGKQIVNDLGGTAFYVEPEFKALYHASAVTACGHLVALVDVAVEMLSKCGIEQETAVEILVPLIKSTVENIENQGTADALTGTFARGDTETFERHLASLKLLGNQEIERVYLQLGERSLHLAEKQNLSREKSRKLREKLSLAKKNLRC